MAQRKKIEEFEITKSMTAGDLVNAFVELKANRAEKLDGVRKVEAKMAEISSYLKANFEMDLGGTPVAATPAQEWVNPNNGGGDTEPPPSQPQGYSVGFITAKPIDLPPQEDRTVSMARAESGVQSGDESEEILSAMRNVIGRFV